MQSLKFFHILVGITMLGFVVGYYFYFNFTKNNLFARQRILRLSLLMDCFILFFIITLFITGTYLAISHHLLFSIPWVHMAYLLMTLVMGCWLILVFVKIINYHSLRKGKQTFYLNRVFHTCHILIIVLMIVIIHDAVTKTPLFK